MTSTPQAPDQAKLKALITPRLGKLVEQQAEKALKETKGNKAVLERLYLNVALNNLSQTVENLLQSFDDFPEFTNDRGRNDLLSFVLTLQVCHPYNFGITSPNTRVELDNVTPIGWYALRACILMQR